ncbi:MAG: glycosyltransferase family 2 protein [Scytonematopsis contorta HA4267-MV1]|jgi:glycosyltransferase involved in cell wall biosynthesis|nr:glycosyltransferase family 2 protein [Scytonematopsis contorta HA4267-MV1]
MNIKPLVSVIIIFLNGEKFIIEAIESVLAQTYDNWELLLVDDGSTDSSTKIARQYTEKYFDKIHYLEHDKHSNHGMSASRNLGISRALGDYITLLDADDIWLPQKLEKQVEILQSYPEVGMVYGATLMWYSWTGKKEDEERDHLRRLGVSPDNVINPPALLNIFLRRAGQTPATCGVMLKREVIEAVDGFEDNFRGMYEDQAFFSKICLKFPVFVESGSWDKYRQHQDSSCYVAAKNGKFHLGKMSPTQEKYLLWLEQYLSENGFKNTEVWRLTQQKLLIVHYPIFRLLENILYYIKRIEERLKSMFKWIYKVNVGT